MSVLSDIHDAAIAFARFGPQHTTERWQEIDGVKSRLLTPCLHRGDLLDFREVPCCGGKKRREELHACSHPKNTERTAWSVMCQSCILRQGA